MTEKSHKSSTNVKSVSFSPSERTKTILASINNGQNEDNTTTDHNPLTSDVTSSNPVDHYVTSVLRQRLGSLALHLGFDAAHSSSLNVLADLYIRYLHSICKDMMLKAELCNRSQPNILDLDVTFRHTMSLSIQSMSEYLSAMSNFTKNGNGELFKSLPGVVKPVGDKLHPLRVGSREYAKRESELSHINLHYPSISSNMTDDEGSSQKQSDIDIGKDESVDNERHAEEIGYTDTHVVSDVCTVKKDEKVESSPELDLEDDLSTKNEVLLLSPTDSVIAMTPTGFISPTRRGLDPSSKASMDTVGSNKQQIGSDDEPGMRASSASILDGTSVATSDSDSSSSSSSSSSNSSGGGGESPPNHLNLSEDLVGVQAQDSRKSSSRSARRRAPGSSRGSSRSSIGSLTTGLESSEQVEELRRKKLEDRREQRRRYDEARRRRLKLQKQLAASGLNVDLSAITAAELNGVVDDNAALVNLVSNAAGITASNSLSNSTSKTKKDKRLDSLVPKLNSRFESPRALEERRRLALIERKRRKLIEIRKKREQEKLTNVINKTIKENSTTSLPVHEAETETNLQLQQVESTVENAPHIHPTSSSVTIKTENEVTSVSSHHGQENLSSNVVTTTSPRVIKKSTATNSNTSKRDGQSATESSSPAKKSRKIVTKGPTESPVATTTKRPAASSSPPAATLTMTKVKTPRRVSKKLNVTSAELVPESPPSPPSSSVIPQRVMLKTGETILIPNLTSGITEDDIIESKSNSPLPLTQDKSNAKVNMVKHVKESIKPLDNEDVVVSSSSSIKVKSEPIDEHPLTDTRKTLLAGIVDKNADEECRKGGGISCDGALQLVVPPISIAKAVIKEQNINVNPMSTTTGEEELETAAGDVQDNTTNKRKKEKKSKKSSKSRNEENLTGGGIETSSNSKKRKKKDKKVKDKEERRRVKKEKKAKKESKKQRQNDKYRQQHKAKKLRIKPIVENKNLSAQNCSDSNVTFSEQPTVTVESSITTSTISLTTSSSNATSSKQRHVNKSDQSNIKTLFSHPPTTLKIVMNNGSGAISASASVSTATVESSQHKTMSSTSSRPSKRHTGNGKSSSASLSKGGIIVTQTVGHYVDEEGNQIWICPSCGKQDDGSPMIGCDSCDDWYHWSCVGINTEPDSSQNWFCQRCVAKKRGQLGGGSVR